MAATESEIEVTDKQELDTEVEQTRPGRVFVPAVDIFEDGDGITVIADVPGATNDSVDIDLDDGKLTIEANVDEVAADGETELVHEWSAGRFYRQFSLPDRIDQGRIEAHLADGVLRLRLPKIEQAKPRKIAIAAG